ncbi:MAG: hypothetical protein LBH09_06880, partial [Peptococcaceae bacterium]|nr:hypothetical protein [Peptococcaceae bacterium]
KLWNIGDGSDKAHTALRTQNYNGMGTIAFNHMGWVGNVGQYNMAPSTYFTVYLHPAIWVHASIFGGFPVTDSTDLVIAKLLTIPKGTIVPKAEFTFVFRPKGFVSAGDNMETHLDGTHPGKPDMPVIVDQFISYDPKNQDYVVIPGDNALYLVKESTDILGGFSHTNWILGEGIYKYQVEELPGGIELTGDDNEFESYSDALYDIEISVFKDENGLLYAQYYTMKTVSGHIDEYFLGSSGGEKADPIIFTNKYELNKEKKPPTGIITDNLPYLVLAVVSIIGFIAYVGIRKMRMMNGVNK